MRRDCRARDKRTVGHRLALLVLARTYGRDVRCTGPIYQSTTTAGDQVRIHFDSGTAGLHAIDFKLKGFAVAGEDREFA